MNPLSLIKIIYEDPWLLVVNKPPGVAVHPDPGSGLGSRVHAYLDLQSHLQKERGESLTLFHRLDRDTSGLVILGRRPEIRQAMNDLFEKKKIRKCYTAVVSGRWQPQWNRVENFLHKSESGFWENRSEPPGKPALTTFRLLAASADKSWLEVIPKTGRTHQIRLHCVSKGSPILGDRLYNSKTIRPGDPPQALHAYRVDFKHPQTGEALQLRAAPPEFWRSDWLVGWAGVASGTGDASAIHQQAQTAGTTGPTLSASIERIYQQLFLIAAPPQF